MDGGQRGKSLLHRLGERLDKLLSMSPIDRALVGPAFFGPMGFFYALLAQFLLHNPAGAAHLDLTVLWYLRNGLVLTGLGWMAYGAWGLWLRKYSPGNRIFAWVGMQYYMVTMALVAYCVGSVTSPLAVIFFLASIPVLLVFDLKPVLWSVATYAVLITGLTILSWLQVIPYAPLLARYPWENGRLATMWMINHGGTALFTSLALIGFCAWLVSRWRDQDFRLARMLAEAEAAQRKLVRTESLAVLGESIASIMHDLRNPIAGVSSVIEEVIKDLKGFGDERLLETVHDLEFSLKQQRRAEGFVRSLLSLSRRTEGYSEPLDPNAVVSDALEVLRVQFKREGVALSVQLEQDLPVVRGNFAQLGQVLLNLGRNAVEAMGEKGGSVEFETRQRDGFVEIACRDSGPGISEEVLPKIFESFFTTKGAGEGTGLGLYLARQILARHGGTVEARNRAGRSGAEFLVRLPVAREEGAG
ncbi:MAG: ATP-binding protein [Bdellovibrionota bacterium]